MVDLVKMIVSEAQHQIDIMESRGKEVDSTWLELLKNPVFLNCLKLKIEVNQLNAKDLLACFVVEEEVFSTLQGIYNHVLWHHFPKVGIYEEVAGISGKATVFMALFRVLHKFSLKLDKDAFLARFPFQLLTEEEILALEDPSEYRHVQDAFNYDYIYEMMVLNQEIKGYTTVDHISGVHYLALFIGRQIAKAGIAIDLGWVSGAAALHDIGKFGCLLDEVKKVAYYHYYYSDLWFRDREITYIRQIAVNHSTWDLELANLPIESLVLIYADFRVKGHSDSSWPYPMKFFNLTESFTVIMEKLDNLDADKEKRYRKVYDKLHDFEGFLIANKIKTSWDCEIEHTLEPWLTMDCALLSESQIHDRLRITAVTHNVKAMHTFRNEDSLKAFLYHAKNLEDSHALRLQVHLLSRFSRYLTDGQKFTILDFLYDLFLHPEEDLRKHASETFGKLISQFDAPYGKYLPPSAPEDIFKNSKSNALMRYSNLFITFEDRTEIKVKRIGLGLVNAFRIVVGSTKQIESTLDLLVDMIANTAVTKGQSETDCFVKVLPTVQPFAITTEHIDKLLPRLLSNLTNSENKSEEARIDALMALKQLAKADEEKISTTFEMAGLSSLEYFSDLVKKRIANHSQLLELYLENSHISTPGEVKKRNIAGLIHYVINESREEAFGAVIHCCNLLKSSLAQDVRLSAAKAVVALNGHLHESEHVEVVLELLKGLEIDYYAYTKYMPQTLGRLLVGLSPTHLNPILEDLKHRVKTGTPALKVLILKTIAHAINSGLVVKNKAQQELIPIPIMLGILTSGLVQDEESVHLAAFQGLSSTILNSHLTSLEQRGKLFMLYSKKLSTLIKNLTLSVAMEVAYAHNFSVLYHFMTEHLHEVGQLPTSVKSKAAYFQGAFDPVSLGQKSVVLSLEEHSVATYISLDAFSWQRQTQAVLHRRKMLEMTFADCLNTHLLPSDFSIYFSHPDTLNQLKERFPEGDPYLVMGEDALISHALYKGTLDTIKDWPHFLISRDNLTSKRHQQVLGIREQLTNIIVIDPIGYHSSITPDHVRRAIDKGLDLEDVLDPLAIDYLKDKHLYRNEPQFKATLEQKHILALNAQALTAELEAQLLTDLGLDLSRVKSLEKEALQSLRLVVIRESNQGKLIAAGAYRGMLQSEYEKAEYTTIMRRDYVDLYPENSAIIELLHLGQTNWREDYSSSLQTELLVDAINQGYEFAVFPSTTGNMSSEILEALRATGFVEIQELRWLMVSLKMPIALILDAQTVLKEDYRQDQSLRNVLKAMRISLMQGIVKAYPKQVILAFDRGMLYDRLVQLVTAINAPESGQVFGASVAVPYGDLFKRWTLPNTITKALHTERVYDTTMSYFDVMESPYHLPVKDQVALIKAFNMPVLLIDDLLDKGLRLQAIEGAFKESNIVVNSIVVGIMSGLGQRRMDQKGYAVSAGYFLPNIGGWFTESLLYPFIGGDSMRVGGEQSVQYGVLQSVNRIAPYFTSPEAKNMTASQYLQLSQICIDNAMSYISEIEKVYEQRHHRPLTMNRLSEVFIAPRMPYYGDEVTVNPHAKASDQLKCDKQRLIQTVKLISRY